MLREARPTRCAWPESSGFARADVPDEPGIIHVTISLDDLPALQSAFRHQEVRIVGMGVCVFSLNEALVSIS